MRNFGRSFYKLTGMAAAVASVMAPVGVFGAGTTSVGPQFTVADFPGQGTLFRLAGGAGSNFVVSWYPNASGPAPVQAFAADGTPVSPVLSVGTSVIGSVAMAVSKSGNFVVAWTDGALVANLYAQRYSAAGVAQGTRKWLGTVYNGPTSLPLYCGNSKICDHSRGSSPLLVAMDDDGDFAVGWTESRYHNVIPLSGYQGGTCTSTDKTYAAVYNANGGVRSFKRVVSSEGTLGGMAMSGSGTLAMLYNTSTCNGQQALKADFYSLNLASQGSAQLSPVIDNGIKPGTFGIDGAGNLTIGWEGDQSGYGRSISLVRFASSGSQIGSTLGPYADPMQVGFTVSVASAGEIAVGWNVWTTSDGQNFGYEKNVQFLTSDGAPKGGVTVVDDSTSHFNDEGLGFAYLGNGDLVGIWDVPNDDNTTSIVGRIMTP